MAVNTALTITLTAQFMRDLGYTFDAQGKLTTTPKGIWSSALWFGNNDTASGYQQLIDNGSSPNATPILDKSSSVTGFKFTMPAFTQDAVKGGALYIALASDTSLKSDPFAGLTEGLINNVQQAQDNNFTFGTFEFTLQGGPEDKGDLTAISTFGLPMSATAIVNNAAIDSVGYKVPGEQMWSAISDLGSKAAPTVYTFDASRGPLSGDAFAVTPTTAVGGGFTPPKGLALPFDSTDWYPYLDSLSEISGAISRVSGTYNGAVAPVNNWVSSTDNVQTNIWHNAGVFDYEISYRTDLSVKVDGATSVISGFLLSPTEASQVKGFIVIPKGNEADLAAGWNGGLANSVYSTLGMAQVYAQDPSVVSGQTPFLFQDATADNNGSASKPATSEFFNVGANTQWGKVFTEWLTGLAAGYLGSTGKPINPLDTSDSVDLSQSWNWDPTYAFDQNLATRPYGQSAPFQFTDEYAKIFFQQSNVYGDMYSDNLMSLYTTGSPLLTLSSSAGNVDEVNLTVFGTKETPTGYVTPTINNYPYAFGVTPTFASPAANKGTYTLNFTNPAGADGQQSFVADESRMSIEVRVWDPTLNKGAGGFSNTATLPAFPTAEVTVSGIVGQKVAAGTVLQVTGASDSGQWTVQGDNNFIIPSGGSTLNGNVKVTVSADQSGAVLPASAAWQDVAIAFPNVVSFANAMASKPGATSQDPEQVTVRLSGDGGANFEEGYVVDAANNRWTFPAGTIEAKTGFVDVLATAPKAGVSVGANEAWKGLFQWSAVATESASVPGLFWSDYSATYAAGELSFANQNATSQKTGVVQFTDLPLAQTTGDVVWYQLIVTDTETKTDKTFNFYPKFGDNTPGSQNIDGGASIALGSLTNQYTINLSGSGTNALPGNLFVADQFDGAIPLKGTPFAPVIGTQSDTFYQYLGQDVNFKTLTTATDKHQPTSGSNHMTGVPFDHYVFGWTGLNPASLDDGTIGQWTNKANGLDIVQINVVDVADPTRNKTVFSQADIDGQWHTGKSMVLDPIGVDIELASKPVPLTPGRTYEINYQEFLPTDSGLAGKTPSGTAPISQVSNVLTVTVAGKSGMMSIADNATHDFVYSLYEGLLDRVPDQGGFEFWADQGLDTATAKANMIESFMASPEFQSKWSTEGHEAMVDAAYAYVLDRVPDDEGEAYWLQALDQGRVSEREFLHQFIESAESISLTDTITANGYLAFM